MSGSETTSEDIRKVLGLGEAPQGRRRARVAVIALALLLMVGLAIWYSTARNGAAVQYRTAEVTRGDLTVSVTATGTVQPVNQVDVGTEISGTIRTVEVDYNDRVKIGQVLARIDTEKLQAQVLQSQSTLESAQAKLTDAQATVVETRDNLERFKQVREMSGGQVPSQREFDAASALLKRAQSNEATLTAQISEAKWKLSIDQTNLSKAVIRSPINGVVLKRQVEPGQTVAASLQTPVLFTIAENLAQMEVQVDVDEADVAQVKLGQQASFTVDGYPGRTFSAIDRVKSAIERLMRERRHLAPNEENDFSVMDTRQIAQTLTGTTRILTLLLSAVAAVSLLVGGIGIMNIMLVSVTERTREIGIRLAIGAFERDVLTQFLVEAMVLASFGGLFGILLALAASAVLAQVLQVPLILNPGIMILAFLFSGAVGVIFGYVPARRAARLDPIEALRHE